MEKCTWALSSPSEEKYHDEEWGVPQYDDQILFEFLILEGVQAGLSWSTVLNKRAAYRIAFDQFEAEKIALYDQSRIETLLQNSDIIRNKLKINAAVINAQAFLAVKEEFGSFSEYIWQFTQSVSIQNNWQDFSQVPATTPESEKMSRSLKQKGFKFVGPTICYAYMQAVGMVNDHTVNCYRHQQIKNGINE